MESVFKGQCEGMRVVVTAGASGIGLAIARQFAAAGARVHICDIAPQAISEVTTSGITGCEADVSENSAVEHFFQSVEKQLGGLDVLVNNAGVTGPFARVEEIDPVDWEKTFAVNVHGAFHCIRHAVPMMKSAGGGLIVNISSVAGRLGFPMRSPYSASKWALIGLTQSLAMELGEFGIRVNALLPGFVSGDRHDRNLKRRAALLGIEPADLEENNLSRISLERLVDPVDIAATAVFLASTGGRNISGQSIGVCGNVETMG